MQSANILADAYARFAEQLYKASTDIQTYEALRDSLSFGQIQSKLELIQALIGLSSESNFGSEKKLVHTSDLNLDRCLFIGHWHGLLPLLMKKMNLIQSGTGLELSQFWSDFSKKINHDWAWTSCVANAADPAQQRLYSNCTAVVNTSCEHMSQDWLRMVLPGTTVIAQTSDYQIPEHTNTCTSIYEFKNKLQLTKILFESEKKFSVYKRFTVIGVI